MKDVCVIVAAAPFCSEGIKKVDNAFIIAADRGLKTAEAFNINPDIVIGDFDSLGEIPKRENVIRLNPVKDDTDTLYCVKTALERGFKTMLIYGGTGGRTEHTLANIATLIYAKEHGANALLIGEGEIIIAVQNESLRFKRQCEGFFSLFSAQREINVTLKGLKYEVENKAVYNSFPIGVSNEFIGKEAFVKVCGTAIIVYEEKNGTDAVEYI